MERYNFEKYGIIDYESMGAPEFTKTRKIIALSLLILLPAVMSVVFLVSNIWGFNVGYISSYFFYWAVFCLLVPYLLLGKLEFMRLFTNSFPGYRKIRLLDIVLLALPVICAILFGPFLKLIPDLYMTLVILSLFFAIANGICEEILWRGLYCRMFHQNPILGCVLPAFGYALWHIARQMVNPYNGGFVLFLVGALFIGICWNIVAYRTKSIQWTVLAHIILDLSTFEALVYY